MHVLILLSILRFLSMEYNLNNRFFYEIKKNFMLIKWIVATLPNFLLNLDNHQCIVQVRDKDDGSSS